ncbi:helix-turn-helix domain-containing protein [Acidicapsa ligni]|uniref:helix-turn-helix domain-containing protein n=1 Tax=Acidicapsa ligni TaxID=542300 RepID=UPI0021DFAF66|nr:helix-turn-helix transcriptional regulator [Acidicapsa ligni]
MTGEDLKSVRTASNWTQSEAAFRLGVTQAYLSMVERGSRPVSNALASKVVRVFPLPATARPIKHRAVRRGGEEFFKRALGELGYPGFAYLESQQLVNPAKLLLLALDSEDLDARVTEALPWLPMHFPDMNWGWLTSESKSRDRQNRLAYVALLASDVAQKRGEFELAEKLRFHAASLERSRLANEDTLAHSSLSEAERKWLRTHRPPSAAHWNLLTDLKAEDLQHVF